jgi:hypothetical protein
VGTTLRFKIVLALLPEEGLQLQQDAQAHLDWLHNALDELRQDPRKSIHTLNF